MRAQWGLLVTVALLGACSSSSHHTTTTPTTVAPVAVPASGCPAAAVPAGFTLDAAHSGPLQAADYSESGDMQAAMIYDHYQGGYRTVYTNLHPVAGGDQDLVVECTVLQFATLADSTRFVSAFTALRAQAGSLAQQETPTATVGTQTVEYAESGQGFAGYGITSTNVDEIGVVSNTRFSTVSVAGPTPSRALASALVATMVQS